MNPHKSGTDSSDRVQSFPLIAKGMQVGRQGVLLCTTSSSRLQDTASVQYHDGTQLGISLRNKTDWAQYDIRVKSIRVRMQFYFNMIARRQCAAQQDISLLTNSIECNIPFTPTANISAYTYPTLVFIYTHMAVILWSLRKCSDQADFFSF